MTPTPALAPYTILCSRYIESVSTPSSPSPPTRSNSLLVPRWAGFYITTPPPLPPVGNPIQLSWSAQSTPNKISQPLLKKPPSKRFRIKMKFAIWNHCIELITKTKTFQWKQLWKRKLCFSVPNCFSIWKIRGTFSIRILNFFVWHFTVSHAKFIENLLNCFDKKYFFYLFDLSSWNFSSQ